MYQNWEFAGCGVCASELVLYGGCSRRPERRRSRLARSLRGRRRSVDADGRREEPPRTACAASRRVAAAVRRLGGGTPRLGGGLAAVGLQAAVSLELERGRPRFQAGSRRTSGCFLLIFFVSPLITRAGF